MPLTYDSAPSDARHAIVDLERSDDAEAALHDMRAASAVDLGDYFRFGVERSRQRVPHEHDRAVRFHVAADLAGAALRQLHG